MTVNLIARKPGVESTKNMFSGANVKTSKVYTGITKYEDLVPDKYVDIIVGVFFDGTMNNRKNVQSRKENEKKQKGETYDSDAASKFITASDEDTSYYNDESNVSRIEPHYEKFSKKKLIQTSVYIEGIATEDYKKDSPKLGGGLGVGPTGIIAKVMKGCEEAVKKLKNEIGDKKINRLYIDAYGFSRGAAAARNFVHEVTQRKGDIKAIISNGEGTPPTIIEYQVNNGALGEELDSAGIKMRLPLSVRFVGLYDTVAAHGVVHFNDTRELNLDAVGKARHTLQLAADDEVRDNFGLTNIESTGNKGTERFLPGVHSDIGGGYIDGAKEKRVLDENKLGWFGLADRRQEFIDQGWYKESEIEVHKILGQLIGERESISNQYSYIPLQIMGEFAKKKKVDFLVGDIKDSYPINNKKTLVEVKKVLDQYVRGSRDKMSWNNLDDRILLRELRHDYFHISAHYGNTAWVLEPMSPRIVKGKPKRAIRKG